MDKTRVFMNGRSQAVRIPARYRFRSSEVYIQHDPQSGNLVLSEKRPKPSLDEIFAMLDDAGGAAELFADRDLSLAQEREWE